jgi:hypothetical protein
VLASTVRIFFCLEQAARTQRGCTVCVATSQSPVDDGDSMPVRREPVDRPLAPVPHAGIANRRAGLASLATLAIIGGCGEPSPRAPSAAGAADQPPWFVESTAARGIDWVHRSGHQPGRYLFPETVCGGVAMLDFDGDGWLDLYFVQAGDLAAPPQSMPGDVLYRNSGDGTFSRVTDPGAIIRGFGMGAATGDFDNDGDADLYLTHLGPNVLLRNDGGRLTDVSSAAGVALPAWSAGSAFLDYDADGDLDLFVANYINWVLTAERRCYAPSGLSDYCHPNNYEAPARDTLFRNNGDGTFTDVSVAAGLNAAFGNGLGVVCADFNGDARTDIFVANDGMRNQLWLNLGDGRFIDGALLAGCAIDQDGQAKAGMGVDAADLDDDGDFDLLVVNLHNEIDSLYRNEGTYFTDAAPAAGLGLVSRAFTRFGAAFIDFNNDGWLDLYEANGRVRRQTPVYGNDPFAEPNTLFRGGPDGRFTEVLPRGGTSPLLAHASRAAAFGDLDNDGGIDVVVVNRDGPAYLLRNIVPSRGHWVLLRVLDEHGRDALGAEVRGTVGARTITRIVRTAYSYCAAHDPRVHVGLGSATTLDGLTVRWPDGAAESYGTIEADRVVEIRRGRGSPAVSPAP